MSTAVGPFLIQDADDVPSIARGDAGKFLAVRDDEKGFFYAAPQTVIRSGGVMRSGYFAIQDARDGTGTLGPGDIGKVPVWDGARFAAGVPTAGDAATLGGHTAAYFLPAASYTASDILTKIETVDGSGSGLDADLLDGLDSLAFLKATGTVTGATSQAQVFANGMTANAPVTINSTESLATDLALSVQNTGFTELITGATDRDFSGAGNWTGTNWAVSAGTLLHTTGSTADAVLANANLTASSIISGRLYYVTYTVAGRTVGTVTPKVGTVAGTAASTNGTFTIVITAAANNANLIFTPTSTFDGSLDNISIKRVPAIFAVLNNGFVGIGRTDPQRLLDLKAVNSATQTFVGLYNPDTTDNNGVVFSFRADSTGTGATTYKEVGAMRCRYTTHDNATFASEYAFFNTLNGTEVQALTLAGSTGMNAVGIATPAAKWHVAGNLSAAAWGFAGIQTQHAAATFTDTSTAGSGTATNAVANSFAQPTFAATNASTVVTNAANVYIANAPTGSGVTLTHAYALWVDAGATRLDGNVGFYGVEPVAQQTRGATLTNNVTAGGTTDTIANYTDLTTYANDAAAIRNDIYQLARALAQHDTALRAYGLLT